MSQQTLETKEFGNGVVGSLYHDDSAENPREMFETLGTMVCFHTRYRLGDNHEYEPCMFSSWGDLEWKLRKKFDIAVILPLHMMDHSGLYLKVGSGNFAEDPGGWDSGTVGFIYATKQDVKKAFRKKRVSKKQIAQAEAILRGEVETYAQFLRGEVYYYVIENSRGDTLDSCGDIYGYEYALELMDEQGQAHAKDLEILDAIELVETVVTLSLPLWVGDEMFDYLVTHYYPEGHIWAGSYDRTTNHSRIDDAIFKEIKYQSLSLSSLGGTAAISVALEDDETIEDVKLQLVSILKPYYEEWKKAYAS